MKKTILLVLLIVTGMPHYAQTKTLNLCVDERNWYPFLYLVDRVEIRGIHVDIVRKAVTHLGYDLNIKAYPRKQCIDRLREREVDGMISLAYHSDLASFSKFPPEAEISKRSKWRIMQVDYMVVTHRSKNYRFRGDFNTLPNPIRIPLGETVVSDLPRETFIIDDGARDDRRNFLKLLRDKDGVVIITSVMAERFLKDMKLQDRIIIHSIPFKSQSYFLAFSQRNNLSAEEEEKIWQEIVRWRDDYVFMLQLFAKY